MSHAYTEAREGLVGTYRRVHANGEQTYVYIVSAGESAYVGVVADVDPREYEGVSGEVVAYDPTLEGVQARVERWLQSNPKGLAGSSGGASGLLGRLLGVLRRVDDYGSGLAQQGEVESDD